MREWRHLHLILVDELEDIAGRMPKADAAAVAQARHELALLVSEGVCESTSQYAALQQAEAEARLRDLEGAHAQMKALQSAYAELLLQAMHDLRGGLGVVDLATRVIGSNAPESDRKTAVQAAERGVTAMNALLGDLVNLARLEAGRERLQVQVFDAGAMLMELAQALAPLASERGLELVMEGAVPLLVQGDAVKLRRIVQNLVQNALRYKASGRVSIGRSTLKVDPGDRWVVQAEDTGPGFAAGSAAPMAAALRDATKEAAEVAAPEPADIPRSQAAPGAQPMRQAAPLERASGCPSSSVRASFWTLRFSCTASRAPAPLFGSCFPPSIPERSPDFQGGLRASKDRGAETDQAKASGLRENSVSAFPRTIAAMPDLIGQARSGRSLPSGPFVNFAPHPPSRTHRPGGAEVVFGPTNRPRKEAPPRWGRNR